MKRILFVDDEPEILGGLRRMLRPRRSEWQMCFVEGGEEALAQLAQQPFDAIVADMRMPKMDGATLLQQFQERSPGTARIVLSAHTELEPTIRALPVAHHFLSKPCDSKTLVEIVDRACRLQELLGDEALASTAGQVSPLPCLPRTYAALGRAMAEPDVDQAGIAAVVESDPALCARVLQIVNGGFFGLTQGISSVEQAVGYLGTDMIRSLVLAVEVFRPPPDAGVSETFLTQLQNRSTQVAGLARRLSGDKNLGSDAFMAGMLHDIGILVLALGVPDRLERTVREAERLGESLEAVEARTCETTHAELGAYMLGLWGLPYPIVEAVAHHHHPSRVGEGDRDLLTAVHVAQGLVAARTPRPGWVAGAGDTIDLVYLESAGVADRLPEWEALANEQFSTGATD